MRGTISQALKHLVSNSSLYLISDLEYVGFDMITPDQQSIDTNDDTRQLLTVPKLSLSTAHCYDLYSALASRKQTTVTFSSISTFTFMSNLCTTQLQIHELNYTINKIGP